MFGMGIAAGDYDRDGLLDYYMSDIGPNNFAYNNGDDTFTDVAVAAGVERLIERRDDRLWSRFEAKGDVISVLPLDGHRAALALRPRQPRLHPRARPTVNLPAALSR